MHRALLHASRGSGAGPGGAGATGRCGGFDKSTAVSPGLLRRRFRRVPFFQSEKRYEKALFKFKVPRSIISELTRCAGWPLRGAGFAKIRSEDPVALAGMGRSPHENGSASKVARCARGGARSRRVGYVEARRAVTHRPMRCASLHASYASPQPRRWRAQSARCNRFRAQARNPSHGHFRKRSRPPRDQPGPREARSPKGPAPTVIKLLRQPSVGL